jgi:uncharacterized protein YdiU (UPF0061 family)
MGQKLGFLVTKPSSDADQQSPYAKTLVADADFRELSTQEKDCITELFELMTQTGSDFTDTFRILGQFSTSSDNTSTTVDKLVAIGAPLKLLEKKEDDSPYSPAELARIEAILSRQP